jgi:hypothetical protein
MQMNYPGSSRAARKLAGPYVRTYGCNISLELRSALRCDATTFKKKIYVAKCRLAFVRVAL